VPTEPRSRSAETERPGPARGGPPPLSAFGLVLHHDGSWTHEGDPITHAKLRRHFDRNVRYLPAEQKYVVTLRHFRGEIAVEEAAFFVRAFEPGSARITLSDRSEETLDPLTLAASPIDGALLCRVKRDLAPGGLLARFTHAAQADLLHAVDPSPSGMRLCVAGAWRDLPDL
jgi:hypothetical protein